MRHPTRGSLLEQSHDGRPSRHMATEANSPTRTMIIEDLNDDKNSDSRVEVVRFEGNDKALAHGLEDTLGGQLVARPQGNMNMKILDFEEMLVE